MAHRYKGDPHRIVNHADAAQLLGYTAQLPPDEFMGGVLRFADEFGGNMYWIYYIVTDTPQTKPWTIRRLVGMSGDNEQFDVPATTIADMGNSEVRQAVNAMKNRYRSEAPLVRHRRDVAAARNERESRQFTAKGTVRIK
jgi:hypothetical protein